ncbi:serine hydrolase domain-containing protein [Marinicella meishanensis]|uniref:serine hydrolase domain-containing protein n=1 Tax=Marinicella meishanensis TaxID=2873263 RepID=UPI001CBEB783|nr:serine hydrolase [Marinicella sp. NBU2979]
MGCAQHKRHTPIGQSDSWDDGFCEAWPGFHAVLVVNLQNVQFERYCTGDDWRLGEFLGPVSFNRNRLHDVRSISKTITAWLVGVAIEERDIVGVDQPLHQLLPNQYVPQLSGRKQQITLRHVLTMTAGLAWDEETLPYSNPENDERQMSVSHDPAEFVLQKPLISEPGSRFNYHGGMTHLLKVVLENVTGLGIESYAQSKLFEPLGIKRWQWLATGNARPSAYAGLRLSPDALQKMARLVLNEGQWDGVQIIPSKWLAAVNHTQVSYQDGEAPDFVLDHGYGYQVWTNSMHVMDQIQPVTTAMGNGGQRIIWYPRMGCAVVVLAGGYGAEKMNWLPELMVQHWLSPVVMGCRRFEPK